MGTNNVLEMDTLNFVPIFAPLFHEFQVVTSKFMIFKQLPEKCYTCNCCNVANRSMSRLVALLRINFVPFRTFRGPLFYKRS